MEQKKNGKKFAAIIIGSMVIASLVVVLIISAFYEFYDPTKYGRSNGGVDENTKLQIEQMENDSKSDDEK